MSSVEEIKNKLDITDLVDEYVELKKAGANFKGLCPFHNEKSPSFMVSKEKQIWHCFGCGKGGDVFKFLMEKEGMDFGESLRVLAKKAGITLSLEDRKISGERTKLLAIIDASARFYHECLLHNPEAHAAREYLKGRKLTAETVVKFKLGFAPDAWDALIGHLQTKYQTKLEDIVAAGLALRKEKTRGEATIGREFYDRFRARIMFPIHDAWGHVVGFTGRIMPHDEKRAGVGGKYVNTPSTALYNKSAVLYGLHFAKDSIRTKNSAVIVEGNMDAIASHQAGIANVVASSGTAITSDQIRLLKRFTDTLVLAFDADFAGETAALRGLREAMKEGVDVKIVTMPEQDGHAIAKDPDELINKKTELWSYALEQAQPIIQFLIDKALRGKDAKNIETKRSAAKIVIPILAMITDPVAQAVWVRWSAERLDIPEDAIHASFKTQGRNTTERVVTEKTAVRDRKVMLAQRVLSFVLDNPALWDEASRAVHNTSLGSPELNALYSALAMHYNGKIDYNPTADDLKAYLKQDESLIRLIDVLQLLVDKDFGDSNEQTKLRELRTSLYEFNELVGRDVRDRLTRELQEAEKGGNQAKVMQVLTKLQALTKTIEKT